MTPTEKARRIDALVQGPEGRRDLACMIVNREADLEDARAENEKLRELVRDMWKPFCWAQSGYEVCLTHEQDVAIRRRVCELGVVE